MSRGLRTWEIALFVWTWQAATLALASAVGALVTLSIGYGGLGAAALVMALDPLRRWERRSWSQVKASHRS